MRQPRTTRPQVALEMTMRDVLGNVEELAGEFAFRDMGGEFEILSIEPASPNTPLSAQASNTREILSARVETFTPTSREVA